MGFCASKSATVAGRRTGCTGLLAVTQQSSDFAAAPARGHTLVGWATRRITSWRRAQWSPATCAPVRSLVGALLAVGEHRREPAWCGAPLMCDRRSSDFAPARGLTPEGVDYSPDHLLAARSDVTREAADPLIRAATRQKFAASRVGPHAM